MTYIRVSRAIGMADYAGECYPHSTNNDKMVIARSKKSPKIHSETKKDNYDDKRL